MAQPCVLVDELEHVSSLICSSKEGRSLRGSIGRPYVACSDGREFDALVRRSVFLAAAERCEQDGMALADFDWIGERPTLLEDAMNRVRLALIDKDRRSRDAYHWMRLGAWDSWSVVVPQEEEFEKTRLADVWTELRAVLAPEDAEVLERVYRYEEKPAAIAEQLVRTSDRYAGPDGYKRALLQVYQRLTRARIRASQRLPSAWKARAKEIA